MPQIRQDIVIDAPPEKVWTVLGERFGDVALWAGSVHASAMITPELRECQTILGTVHERLLEFDPRTRCLEYEAVEGPKWFRRATNRWCVDDLGEGRSRVRMHARIALKPVYGHGMMLLSAPRMLRLSRSVSDLKRYVETNAYTDEPERSEPGARSETRQRDAAVSTERTSILGTCTAAEEGA